MTASSMQKIIENVAHSFTGWALFAGKFIGGLALTVTVILYFNQDRMLYIPNPPGFPKNPTGKAILIFFIQLLY